MGPIPPVAQELLAIFVQTGLADLEVRDGGRRGLEDVLDLLEFLAGFIRQLNISRGIGMIEGAAQGAGFAVPQLVARLFETLDSFQQAELGLQQFPLSFPSRQAVTLVRQLPRQTCDGFDDLRVPLIQVHQGLAGLPERLGRRHRLGEQIPARAEVGLPLTPGRQVQSLQELLELRLLFGPLAGEVIALGGGAGRLRHGLFMAPDGFLGGGPRLPETLVLGQPPVIQMAQSGEALEEARESLQQAGIRFGSRQPRRQLVRLALLGRQGGFIGALLIV